MWADPGAGLVMSGAPKPVFEDRAGDAGFELPAFVAGVGGLASGNDGVALGQLALKPFLQGLVEPFADHSPAEVGFLSAFFLIGKEHLGVGSMDIAFDEFVVVGNRGVNSEGVPLAQGVVVLSRYPDAVHNAALKGIIGFLLFRPKKNDFEEEAASGEEGAVAADGQFVFTTEDAVPRGVLDAAQVGDLFGFEFCLVVADHSSEVGWAVDDGPVEFEAELIAVSEGTAAGTGVFGELDQFPVVRKIKMNAVPSPGFQK